MHARFSSLLLTLSMLVLTGSRLLAQSACLPLYSLPCLPPPVCCDLPCPPDPCQQPGSTTAPGGQGSTASLGDGSTPVVTLAVRVAATSPQGQDLEYQLVVRNASNQAAHHVLVRNPLPANTRFVRAVPEPANREGGELVWQFGTLEGGATRDIRLVLAPTSAEDVRNCARVQFEHGQCVTTRIARPSFSLRKIGPAQATLNQVLNYQLLITNTGQVEVKDIVLTDLLPPGLQNATGEGNRLIWKVESLAPGQSRTFDYQVRTLQLGQHRNHAVASAAGGLRETAESLVTVAEARMKVSMTGPPVGYLNYPAAYQITVANQGGLPLSNVVIDNPTPANAQIVSASQGGQNAGNGVRWVIGPLEPGASRTVDLVLKATQVARIVNMAQATAEGGLTDRAEFETNFAGASALGADVKVTNDPVPVGGATSYEVTIRNQGMVAATNVRIRMSVPPELEITRTGPVKFLNDAQVGGPSIISEAIAIPPGGQAQFRIEAKAIKAGRGDIRINFELMATELPGGPVLKQVSTTIYNVAPAIRRKDPAEIPRLVLGWGRSAGDRTGPGQ